MTREQMLEQALRALKPTIEKAINEHSCGLFNEQQLRQLLAALALPADDDVGGARTHGVAQTAARTWQNEGARASDNNGEARDAERYRWLRSHINDPVSSYTNVYEPTPEQLDSIVDSAMEAGRLCKTCHRQSAARYDEKKRQRKIAAQKDKP